MQSLRAYDDVPAIEGSDFVMADAFGLTPLHNTRYSSWNGFDYHPDLMMHHQNSHWYHSEMPIPTGTRSFTAYDPSAHGFSYMHPPDLSGNSIFQFGLPFSDREDPGQYRRTRYPSPMSSGISISSPESSFSETCSPESSISTIDFPLSHRDIRNMQMSPSAELYNDRQMSWSPQAPFVPVLPSMPFTPSQAACTLKQLQLAPQVEEDVAAYRDTDKNSALVSIELTFTEDPCLSDSEAEISFDESHFELDREADIVREASDNDPEYVPLVGTRKSSLAKQSSPRSQRRRSSNLNKISGSGSVLTPQSRVQKPSGGVQGRKTSRTQNKSKARKGASMTAASLAVDHPKAFPCTFHHYRCFGTFASKNEWKRHVASQHLQLGFYRCDMGSCAPEVAEKQNRGYNDFNRKDLFTQHCRRMHGPWVNRAKEPSKAEKEQFDMGMEEIRKRCWEINRDAPIWSQCGFCKKVFHDEESDDGHGGSSCRGKSWEERMEHVGRHYERDAANAAQEAVDQGLREWALSEGVIEEGVGKKQGQFWLVGYNPGDATRDVRPRRRRTSSRRVSASTRRPKTDVDELEDDDESDEAFDTPAVPAHHSTEDEDEDVDADADFEDDEV